MLFSAAIKSIKFQHETEKETKGDKVKLSILLHFLGQEDREIYSAFIFETKEDSMVFDRTIEKLDEYFISCENLVFFRYKFLTYRHVKGQSIDEFVISLPKLSSAGEIGELKSLVLTNHEATLPNLVHGNT